MMTTSGRLKINDALAVQNLVIQKIETNRRLNFSWLLIAGFTKHYYAADGSQYAV